MRALLSEQLRYFSERVSQVERELLRWHRTSEPSPRLEAIGGVGPITATAIGSGCADRTRTVRGQRYRRSHIQFATSAAQRTISPYIRIFPLRRSTITI